MSSKPKQPGRLMRRPPASGRKPARCLSTAEIAHLCDDLMAYHRQFYTVLKRREQQQSSMSYLCGQLSALERKTIEPMVLALHGPDLNAIRAVQHFISESPWSAPEAVKQHQRMVAEALGDSLGVVIVDGSGFPKQGPYSAGVGYQYCGHLGKLANCQEGVFAVYATRHGYTFLDARLYMPEPWFAADHKMLRERCGIPDKLAFQTEPALALTMVTDLHTAGVVPFRWVACDEHYGQNTAFLDGIAALGQWYFAEVPSDTRVWLRTPAVQPPGRGPLGRPRMHPRLARNAPVARELRAIAANLPRGAWKRYLIKEGSKGPMWAEFAFLRVTTVRNTLPGPRAWAVLRRSLSAPVELKFHLSNAPLACERRDLAQMSGWRWPVETSFEEAKGEAGMDQYETRSWLGWHHHMLHSFMAHFFLIRLRLRLKKSPGAHHCSSPSLGDLRLAGRRPAFSRYDGRHPIPSTPQPRRLPLAS
jgi:SRSO17 transposase